jgi:hypothetical protein
MLARRGEIMKSFLCCIGLVAVAVLTSAACGDSDTPPAGAGGAGGTGGTGGAGGTGGSGGGTCATPDAGMSATVGCVTINECDKLTYSGMIPPAYTCNGSKSTKYPDGLNACRNDADCAIINTGLVRNIVKEVALSCRSFEPAMGIPEADRIAACEKMAECNTKDVKSATSMKIMPPGISDACGQCYTGIALCSVAFCAGQCVADADSADCVKCQFDAGCRIVYERCSGLDRQQ